MPLNEAINERLSGVLSPDAVYQKQLATVKTFDNDASLPNSLKVQLAHLRPDLPNIAILYYGGTLGMKPNDEGHLVPTEDVNELLRPLQLKGLDQEVNVLWFQVVEHAIDSTNGRWPHWVTIGNAINRLYKEFPDKAGGINGFVIAGGTDTMAHMTAAQAYMFPNIGRPVVTTGAQKSIFYGGSDAEANVYFALGVAAKDVSGVHQTFGNKLRDGRFIHKVRDLSFMAFECPQGFEYGELNANGIDIWDACPRRNRFVTGDQLVFDPRFREGTKVVKLSPSTRSESLLHDALDPTAQALLLITYGAGNVRDEGLLENELTHIDILKLLREYEYPVVLGSPMMDGRVESHYASGAKAVAPGVEAISAQNTTGAGLEVKTMRSLALANESGRFNYNAFRTEMTRNHIGEIYDFRR